MTVSCWSTVTKRAEHENSAEVYGPNHLLRHQKIIPRVLLVAEKKQEGQETLNRSPEYTGQKSNI